jgi:DNA ligase D-like protein (predicted ligase)
MTASSTDDAAPTPIDHPTLARTRGATHGVHMPASIAPMLAAEAPEPFDAPEYIFELMFGGMRAMAYVRDGTVHLRARNGRDLTPYFPELLCIPDRLQAREAILDGEIVVLDGEGHPAFEMLRPRLNTIAGAVGPDREQIAELPVQFRLKKVLGHVSFQAFDILWLDGRSLVEAPLWQRKNRLHEVVAPGAEFAPVDFVDDEGIAFFDAVVEKKLDGVVAKQKNSVYTPGARSKSWLNIRALQSGDFVIGGYTIGGARRKGEPFSQLLLGAYDGERFEYVGAVSGGLTDVEARQVVERLEPLHAQASPFHDTPPLARLVYWVEPAMVCRVRFSEWSPEGYLRFPIFSALRPDLSAADCRVE